MNFNFPVRYFKKFIDIYSEELTNIGWFIVFLIFVYLILILILKIIFKTTIKFTKKKYEAHKEWIITIFDALKLIIRFLLILIFTIYAFNQFKININALLTGAGALGAILIIIFQNTLKDIFMGWISIFEDNFRKGETVVINNTFKGKVIDFTFRYLILRLDDGSLLKIPFNKIDIINNFSRYRNISEIKIRINKENFNDEFLQLLEKHLDTFNDINKKIEVFIDKNIVLTNNFYDFKIKIKSPFVLRDKLLIQIKSDLLKNFSNYISEIL